MKARTGYLVVAALLMILNVAVTVCYAVAICKAWPREIWERGLLVLLAVLGPTSLVNVRVQAVFGSGASPGSRKEECLRVVAPIPADVRGERDV